MPNGQPYEIIIHGTTSKGKVFRPSDWSERLCGILSSFDKDHRLSYHQWVHPVLIDNVRSVAIDAKLEQINPPMFRFLMDFAADNDLRVINQAEPAAEPNETAEPQPLSDGPAAHTADTPSETPATAADTAVLREIHPEETATAFAALSTLRPLLTDVQRFVEQVNNVQRPAGYRLIGIFEEGKHNAVAVCGFRETCNLASGRHIFVDDIVTVPQSRNKGYATRLLNEVRQTAADAGIKQLHLNVHARQDRTDAHRLFFCNGFEVSALHLRCPSVS
ncbi:GNAT family N-acetyltransferase [Neisseria sp.]|uniref:GNAT family N-acetyltransferase n=1 Tax=Neisseria sp. TaxID=192066 RepID=UPI0035A0C82A